MIVQQTGTFIYDGNKAYFYDARDESISNDIYTKGGIVATYVSEQGFLPHFFLLVETPSNYVWYMVMPELGRTAANSWQEVVRLPKIVSRVDFAMVNIENGQHHFTAL